MIDDHRYSGRVRGHDDLVVKRGHGVPFPAARLLLLVLALPLAGCVNGSRGDLSSSGGTEPTPGASTPTPRAALSLTVQAGEAGTPISRDLWGIFFEDINWGADGGLYAELVENRSFEFTNTYHAGYDFKTGRTECGRTSRASSRI